MPGKQVFFKIPLFKSGFRPFFLLGSLYGLLLMLFWLPLTIGLSHGIGGSSGFMIWHQHEMLFGFVAAIVCGFIMTALPSWAKSKEIDNGKLALLVAIWLAGRIAVVAGGMVPKPLVGLIDLAFPVAFLIIAGPELLYVKNRFYLLLFPFLLAFFFGNLLFYIGMIHSDFLLAGKGIRLGIYTIIFHCTVVGGFLTPIFTETALQESHPGCHVFGYRIWDWLSLITIPLLALSDLLEFDQTWQAGFAFSSVFIHGMRMSGWRSSRILDKPVLWIMHLGYAWLVIAFALKGLEDLGLLTESGIWVHAFTVGTLGSLMMGFMTRIVLRHTGRPVTPHPFLVVCFYLMFVSGLVRVFGSVAGVSSQLLILSALLWAMPFLVYLIIYGKMLVQPSLPTNKPMQEHEVEPSTTSM
ncbi:MAG: NnrS family protein [Candidatus Thiodiazotropha sp.]